MSVPVTIVGILGVEMGVKKRNCEPRFESLFLNTHISVHVCGKAIWDTLYRSVMIMLEIWTCLSQSRGSEVLKWVFKSALSGTFRRTRFVKCAVLPTFVMVIAFYTPIYMIMWVIWVCLSQSLGSEVLKWVFKSALSVMFRRTRFVKCAILPTFVMVIAFYTPIYKIMWVIWACLSQSRGSEVGLCSLTLSSLPSLL